MARQRRIPEDTAEYARWLAARLAERAGQDGAARGANLSGATTLFVAMALEHYARRLDAREVDRLTHLVVEIGPDGKEVVEAAANNVSAAWGALRDLIPHRRSCRLILRQGAHVIGTYPDDRPLLGMPATQIEKEL